MPIHLVRHAQAGKRSQWRGDDRLRPLSERGGQQAEWLLELLVDTPVRRIVSSPFLRCVQTVEPLAAALGLEVETTEVLAEEADPAAALELLLSLDEHQGVACSHGDIIPALLRQLKADGMAVDGPMLDQKGSVWLLETKKGTVRRGRYVPPGR